MGRSTLNVASNISQSGPWTAQKGESEVCPMHRRLTPRLERSGLLLPNDERFGVAVAGTSQTKLGKFDTQKRLEVPLRTMGRNIFQCVGPCIY